MAFTQGFYLRCLQDLVAGFCWVDLGKSFLFVDVTEVPLLGVSVRWTSVIGFFLLMPLKFLYWGFC